MRATYIRPRTAPVSPERPGTAFSTRSTIRQVEPSPESLSDALANGFPDGVKHAPEPSFEPFPDFDPPQHATDDEPGMHIPSTEPTAAIGALRRGGTPSGPRKSRSHSPLKSCSQSPRKHQVQTPTLPAHQESPSSSYSGERPEPPDTPTPMTREQQRKAYAPLHVRKAFAAKSRSEGGGEGEGRGEVGQTEGYGTHVRIADYMRKTKGQRGGRSASPKKNVEKTKTSESTAARFTGPPQPHIVQAMAQSTQPGTQARILTPSSEAQKQAQKEPARHTSVSRRSEASGASVASKHSIFSTPGRDEMERKKPIVEEDEGPFAKVTSMRDLEQSRRRVSEGTKEGREEGRRVCGMRCAVM